jgi:hypothetical protein
MSWIEVLKFAPGWAAIPLMFLEKWLDARWSKQDRKRLERWEQEDRGAGG